MSVDNTDNTFPLLVTPTDVSVKITEDDILAQGVNMIMPDNLKPNAQYVLQKIRDLVDGAPITPSLIMQLTLQAMMFSASAGPGLGGHIKKDVVMFALRKLVLESDNDTLDITSKTALFILLQNNGAVSSVIDNLVMVSKKATNINLSGQINRCFIACFGQKQKALPKDFTP
jgi:hypothetical protein